MRKIVVRMMQSLDGVIQAPGGPGEDTSGGFAFGGWVPPYSDPKFDAGADDTFREPYDLLLGRKTYDIFSRYWGAIERDPALARGNEGALAMARAFTAARKYVATHSPESLDWKNSEALGADPVARLREIKRGDGPPLLLQGSAKLTRTLLTTDLIDEMRLLVFPIVLGGGKRLFAADAAPTAFRVTKSLASPKGVLALRYERAGEVRTGSFGIEL